MITSDQQGLDEQRRAEECQCPSWWNCDARGCYAEAKARYADYRPTINGAPDTILAGGEYYSRSGATGGLYRSLAKDKGQDEIK